MTTVRIRMSYLALRAQAALTGQSARHPVSCVGHTAHRRLAAHRLRRQTRHTLDAGPSRPRPVHVWFTARRAPPPGASRRRATCARAHGFKLQSPGQREAAGVAGAATRHGLAAARRKTAAAPRGRLRPRSPRCRSRRRGPAPGGADDPPHPPAQSLPPTKRARCSPCGALRAHAAHLVSSSKACLRRKDDRAGAVSAVSRREEAQVCKGCGQNAPGRLAAYSFALQVSSRAQPFLLRSFQCLPASTSSQYLHRLRRWFFFGVFLRRRRQ